MILKLLILSTLVTPLFAAEAEIECKDDIKAVQFGKEVISLLPGKVCPTNDETILKRVKEEYKKYFGALPQVKRLVKGFNLTGSDKELKLAVEVLGKKPPKTWAAAAKDCASIQCAFEKLLGSKEAAMQIFNINAKSGYKMILDQSINQNLAEQIWSPAEIREVDAVVSKLPRELRNLPQITEITRMGDGLRLHGHGANTGAYASPAQYGSKAELVIYDVGMNGVTTGKDPFDVSSWPQEATMHELCHHHDYKGYYASGNGTMTSEQKNSAFKKLSGWREITSAKGESSWVSNKDSEFVSNYAKTAPAEDYAESCMNFVLHPKELKEKAPKKYAFIKANLFNNQEFTDAPWNVEKSKKWPELNNMLADETSCAEKLNDCSKDMYWHEKGYFCSKSNFYCGTAESRLKDNTCFKDFKKSHLQELATTLEADDNFCSYGGNRTIEQSGDSVCKSTSDKLAKALEAAVKIDIKPQIAKCEEQNDFTSECVVSDALLSLNTPAELAPSVERIFNKSVPNRMAALSNKLGTIPTATWLKACLSGVSKVDQWETTKGETIFSYNSSDKAISSGYLGKYIYDDYDHKDINTNCGQKMLSSLEESGIKVPKSGNAVSLMKKPFTDELNSFETEVLAQADAATKKCLLAKCKIEKIEELLKTWENKSPEKRAGFATKEYAEELRNKLK
jgi:hypothetical protein